MSRKPAPPQCRQHSSLSSIMEPRAGVEPASFGLTIRCSANARYLASRATVSLSMSYLGINSVLVNRKRIGNFPSV